MNATSLFISTTRLILLADITDDESWADLYRLLPYLRQSISCAVCEKLLKDPLTPSDTHCQHNVCNKCKGGKKKIKPPCNSCKDYSGYSENLQLRIQLQSYKKLCEYAMHSEIYNKIVERSQSPETLNNETAASVRLKELIQEGVKYCDEYESISNLTKSTYSKLPSVFSTTQNATPTTTSSTDSRSASNAVKTISNGTELYSVSYAGSGNKITIKRKAPEEIDSDGTVRENSTGSPIFKKPRGHSKSLLGKRKGCRCGNATATPGKLTCCGQRCPCYVESKPCISCKCKGCRNPHKSVGFKICPIINLDLNKTNYASIPLNLPQDSSTSSVDSVNNLAPNLNMASDLSFNQVNFNTGNIRVFTPSQLKQVTSIPSTTISERLMAQPVMTASIIKLPPMSSATLPIFTSNTN